MTQARWGFANAGSLVVAVLSALHCGVGCRSVSEGVAAKKAEPVSAEVRAKLAGLVGARVYFAHMSVGENVLSGIRAELEATHVKWPVTELKALADDSLPMIPPTPGLFHAWRGANGEPLGKLQRFASDIRAISEPKPDIVLFKFCFVDVVKTTDVTALFAAYRSAIRSLQREFPKVRYVHVTVPLSAYPGGVSATLRRWVGRGPWEDDGNRRRDEYNTLLRKEFAGDSIFDLARVESELAQGGRFQFSHGDRKVDALVTEYAADSAGHLNPLGQMLAGRELIKVLAAAYAREPGAPE